MTPRPAAPDGRAGPRRGHRRALGGRARRRRCPAATIGGLPAAAPGARVVIGDPFSRYVQLLLPLTRRQRTSSWSTTAPPPWSSSPSWPRGSAWSAGTGAAAAAAARHGVRAVSPPRQAPAEPAPGGGSAGSRCSARCRSTGRPGRARQRNDVRLDPGPLRPAPARPAAPTWSAPPWWRPAWSTSSAIWRRSAALAEAHGATRYFAHRRESAEKLRRVARRGRSGDRAAGSAAGTDRPARPDRPHDRELPVHRGAHPAARARPAPGCRSPVCDVDPAWLTADASPRAQGFLAGVTGTRPRRHRLGSVPTEIDRSDKTNDGHTQPPQWT